MNEEKKHEEKDVVIHIDKKQHRSPNPTTGAALYLLGDVNTEKYQLWEEISGKDDDKLIPNDSTIIEIKNGTHFYTAQKDLNPGIHE